MQNTKKEEKGPNPPSWAKPRPSQEGADQRGGPAEPAQARARLPGGQWAPSFSRLAAFMTREDGAVEDFRKDP